MFFLKKSFFKIYIFFTKIKEPTQQNYKEARALRLCSEQMNSNASHIVSKAHSFPSTLTICFPLIRLSVILVLIACLLSLIAIVINYEIAIAVSYKSIHLIIAVLFCGGCKSHILECFTTTHQPPYKVAAVCNSECHNSRNFNHLNYYLSTNRTSVRVFLGLFYHKCTQIASILTNYCFTKLKVVFCAFCYTLSAICDMLIKQ